MWSLQHSQWLDQQVAYRFAGHVLRGAGVVRALVGRSPTWGLDASCCLRLRREVLALDHDHDVRFCRVGYSGALVHALVLRLACGQTVLVLVPQLPQTRHHLQQHPIGRVPNFLQVRLFQRWFLPIPLDVLIISLVCVAPNHCDFFQEVAGDELMVCLVYSLEQ